MEIQLPDLSDNETKIAVSENKQCGQDEHSKIKVHSALENRLQKMNVLKSLMNTLFWDFSFKIYSSCIQYLLVSSSKLLEKFKLNFFPSSELHFKEDEMESPENKTGYHSTNCLTETLPSIISRISNLATATVPQPSLPSSSHRLRRTILHRQDAFDLGGEEVFSNNISMKDSNNNNIHV